MDELRPASIAEDFRRARRKAGVQRALAQLTGQPGGLLVYDEVRRKLHGIESGTAKRQEVPLNAIVGSVGRYLDYSRAFLPLKDSDEERWVKVKQAVTGLSGVPPIEVYRIGDAYFVKDGNHRVSVARQLGAKTIDAYVTEVATSVPLSPEDTPDALIVKAEYADFLERTGLHKSRPDADLSVSVPGQYGLLLEHIEVHRYFMGQDRARTLGLEAVEFEAVGFETVGSKTVEFEEAAAHWVDTVYLPVVGLLSEHELFREFPGRTSADLYLWLASYRAELERDLGWTLSPDAVTYSLREAHGETPRDVRVRGRNPRHPLVQRLLVAISGTEAGWRALEQALYFAERESLKLYGLHVIRQPDTVRPEAVRPETSHPEKSEVAAVRLEFMRRCAEAGVVGEFAAPVGGRVGGVVAAIADRSRWADLVVAPLSYPPGQARFKLYGGFHTLLRRCHRPILAVPAEPRPFARLLLGYNGTPKATIALFAAAYLSSRWKVELEVVIISERNKADRRVLEQAQRYLEQHGIEAVYRLKEGPIVETLLASLEAQASDLLIVGSYEHSPLLEPILGGVLDDLLRRSRTPLLICQ